MLWLTLKDGVRESYNHFLDCKRPTQTPRLNDCILPLSCNFSHVNPFTPTWRSERQLPPTHSRRHDVAYAKSATSIWKDRCEGVLYYYAGRHEKVNHLQIWVYSVLLTLSNSFHYIYQLYKCIQITFRIMLNKQWNVSVLQLFLLYFTQRLRVYLHKYIYRIYIYMGFRLLLFFFFIIVTVFGQFLPLWFYNYYSEDNDNNIVNIIIIIVIYMIVITIAAITTITTILFNAIAVGCSSTLPSLHPNPCR